MVSVDASALLPFSVRSPSWLVLRDSPWVWVWVFTPSVPDDGATDGVCEDTEDIDGFRIIDGMRKWEDSGLEGCFGREATDLD